MKQLRQHVPMIKFIGKRISEHTKESVPSPLEALSVAKPSSNVTRPSRGKSHLETIVPNVIRQLSHTEIESVEVRIKTHRR
jgi:hypothetical protein